MPIIIFVVVILYYLRADDEGSFEDEEMLEGGEAAFLAAATAAAAKKRKEQSSEKKVASTSSPRRLRRQESKRGNWADLFFVLDVMSGSIDVCEILVFISKTDPLVRQLEEKKVDPGRFWSSINVKTLKQIMLYTLIDY